MRILLGMSGGLDSTYAAMKLCDMGHTVEGALLLMHPYTDIEAAKESADALGIPLHIIDCREKFEKIVVPHFMDEYLSARTPNPCIVCNSEVKFRVLYDYAMEKGFDMIATGHYADVIKVTDGAEERYAVSRSKDSTKDQTYVLWRLPQDILSRLVFPLSDSCKKEVREDAQNRGLAAADREESQEICFIPSGDYAGYIEERRGVSLPGDFVDTDGNVLGRHNGIIRYTVGQRKGLGIALGARAFVTEINPETNKITLAFEAKSASEIAVKNVVFSGMKQPSEPYETELFVKVRYLAPPISAKVTFYPDLTASVSLCTPVKSVTPGQSAVFYDGNRVVAGGFISKSK